MRPKEKQKVGNLAFSNKMASMMHTRSDLVVPKSENVGKPFVFKCFLKGQGCPEHSGRTKYSPRRSVFGWKSVERPSKKKKDAPLAMRWQA